MPELPQSIIDTNSSNTEKVNYVFMDGEYVPYENAKISVRTHAFLYGTSVFEGIRGYWNEEEKQLYDELRKLGVI